MRRLICLCGILTAGVAGCANGTGGEGGVFQRAGGGDFNGRVIPGDLAAIEEVSARVFGSHFLIDRESSSAHHLVARPTEVEGQTAARNLRDRVRLTPGRQRLLAELRIDPRPEGALVQVSVRIQRVETAERASFSRVRGDDRPNRTAIDRPGPAGVDTREEWVNAGRDAATERDILNEIAMSLGVGSQPAP